LLPEYGIGKGFRMGIPVFEKVIDISQELTGPLRLELNPWWTITACSLQNMCPGRFSAQRFPHKSKLQVLNQNKVTSYPAFLLLPPHKLSVLHSSPTNASFLPRCISQSLDVPFTNMFLYCYRGI